MSQWIRWILVVSVAVWGTTNLRAEPFPLEGLKKIDAKMTQSVNRVIALTLMSGLYDDAGMPKEATRTLDEALALVETLEPGVVTDWLRNKTANKLAFSWYAPAGAGLRQFDRAVMLADKITDVPLRAHAYVKLGEKIFKAGDEKKGKALIDKGLAQSREVKDPAARAASLLTAANELASIGAKDEARQVADEAAKIVDALKSPLEMARLRIELAGKYLKLNDKQRAAELFNSSVKSIGAIDSPAERAALFAQMAGEYAEFDDRQQAGEFAGKARDLALALPAAPWKSELIPDHASKLLAAPPREKLLAEIASRYAKVGNTEEALKVSRGIDDPYYRAIGLSKIAETLPKDKAQALLDEARQLTGKTDNRLAKVEMLINVSKGSIKAKDTAKVGDFLKEAEQLLTVPKK